MVGFNTGETQTPEEIKIGTDKHKEKCCALH